MKYLFRTNATMKPYNHKKWWIDGDIIPHIRVNADSMGDALKQYRATVTDKHYIEISDNAMKNKQPIYYDTPDGDAVQCGYVITAKSDFRDDDNYRWVTQYIELWVTIEIVTNPFEEAQV